MIIREFQMVSRSKSILCLLMNAKKPLCFQKRKRVANMKHLNLPKKKEN